MSNDQTTNDPTTDASQVRYDQARYVNDGQYEPLLSEKDQTSVDIGAGDSPLPDDLTRDDLELPELSEPELARHYTRLSQMIYGIDSGPYPLGSCTMKYNPKFTEDVAALPSAAVHPDRSEESIQGTLELLYRLQDYLGRIGGMDAVTLQPPAGAAGEFVGIRVAAAYHEHNGEGHRDEVIIPESAHGTNFATAALGGYDVVSLPSDEDGRVDLDALEAALSENTAALMLTNPNTLGLFERDIEEIADMVHDVGGLLYYDGANLNALLGRARPGDMGFDVMHYNVHKTFATPHGGGGPGAGPVGVVAELEPFLPAPRVREADAETNSGQATYELFDPDHTIGNVHGFQGNWLVLVKAFAYIARLGDEGLTDASAKAVLNANYLASQIEYDVPYGPFHHEFVASAGDQDAADVAKRMLDYGVHPPTTKWPEIVPEALMTEPTEIESKDTLDRLAAAFNAVAQESDEVLEDAPERTTARRIDQTSAARSPRLSWHELAEEDT
ncbi:glycine cleavage system protein P beta subunit [Natrialba magadii ATCC 43099]|uniref:glycine dehydrogenase (aminomethyl-transferring) n=1 Tax=Natrialba magadii (strain ATCC 43099 / DSM 3394 / CCM 3739 / CIP 104546 / IAM 13178 / JCM 8861 / NBRC 102185 / NCIMB 2190 / MS3) TaxID=547559 RepID=D3SXU4_NATMM|nr:aminomethyl-transferring glycine dehydrogenase subunit GcvPB [Natrialba magadii]ADD03984.1 glycine cleavage system protein P beta subunit [Natrialba magadii ATCC 43099]ELY33643.1 glycine dehydrogenase subunit 2 [Natrialba magadii ATCC 43099]